MKTLTLSIKQKYFDEIINGKKTQEFREITPTTGKIYIRYMDVDSGLSYVNPQDIPEGDGEILIEPTKYDAIKFLTGEYKGTRPWALVEVKNAIIEIFTDEDGNDLKYEQDGKTYIESRIIYDLGKVLERS